MNRYDNIGWICRYLLDENPRYRQMAIPENLEECQQLMRSLLNIRMPMPVTQEFLQAQDAEIQAQLADKGVVEIDRQGLVEWQGDITSLNVDAIVNAANSRMLGCFVPMHRCIDNASTVLRECSCGWPARK